MQMQLEVCYESDEEYFEQIMEESERVLTESERAHTEFEHAMEETKLLAEESKFLMEETDRSIERTQQALEELEEINESFLRLNNIQRMFNRFCSWLQMVYQNIRSAFNPPSPPPILSLHENADIPPPPPNKPDMLDRYKAVIAKTLDQYISWWKFSWLGHHHDQRARYLKAEILDNRTDSVQQIQDLLTRAADLITPELHTLNYFPNRSVNYQDVATNQKWNTPTNVVHHTQALEKSGFWKVIDRSLAVNPINPIYQPDPSAWF